MSKNINQTIREKIEKDDVDYINKLISKGAADQLFTKENFEYAAQKGAAEVLKVMIHPALPRHQGQCNVRCRPGAPG